MNDDRSVTTPTTDPAHSTTVGGFPTDDTARATERPRATTSPTGRAGSPPDTSTRSGGRPGRDRTTAGEELGTKARETKDEAVAAAKSAGREAKDLAKDAGKSVGREAKRAADEAKSRLTELADRQTSTTADRLGTVAGALRRAGDELDDGRESALAGATASCAREIDRWAGYLRDRDVGRIVHDVNRLGRRHPEVFLGATFGAGILLGRFLRSSQHHRDVASGTGAATYPLSGGGR